MIQDSLKTKTIGLMNSGYSMGMQAGTPAIAAGAP